MPKTAIAVDSIISETKRVKNCRRGIPRGNNWSMTSRRSASWSGARPRQRRLMPAHGRITRPPSSDEYGSGGGRSGASVTNSVVGTLREGGARPAQTQLRMLAS